MLKALGIYVAFALLLFCQFYLAHWPPLDAYIICGFIALCFLWPNRKYEILACSVVFWLVGTSSPVINKPYVTLLGAFGFAAEEWPGKVITVGSMYWGVALMMAYRYGVSRLRPSSPIRKFSLFLYVIAYFALALLFPWAQLPEKLHFAFWLTILGLWPFYHLAWDLEALKMDRPMTGFKRLAFYLPFWRIFSPGSINGETYQRAVEAKTEAELTTVRLKGLRLMAWATLLKIVHIAWIKFVLLPLHVPAMNEALNLIAKGQSLGTATAWAVTYGWFLSDFIRYTVLGHLMIGTARMAGWNAFRNTYRPFESRNLNEFFVRYNYYFREVLLHCFYLPVYFEFFRIRPKLRTIAAVFASVGFANFAMHAAIDLEIVRSGGALNFLIYELPYAFYCLVLATALSISTLRQMENPRRTSAGVFRRAWNIFGIVTFFACLFIFDSRYGGNIENNFKLLFSLAGIH